MSVELLRSAIASSDVALLAQCPGIGRKTAERLVIELKDKVFPDGAGSATGGNNPAESSSAHGSHYQDAVASLITLGYKPAEANKTIRKATSNLLKRMLKLIRTALS